MVKPSRTSAARAAERNNGVILRALLLVSVHVRLRVGVDQRHHDVHQQHGEGDAVRIAAQGADEIGQHADACAEDQLAVRRGGARYRIGGDEECAQHGAAGERGGTSGEA